MIPVSLNPSIKEAASSLLLRAFGFKILQTIYYHELKYHKRYYVNDSWEKEIEISREFDQIKVILRTDRETIFFVPPAAVGIHEPHDALL